MSIPLASVSSPDLDRIVAEQQAAAQLLQDGHEDQRGLRQACDDWIAEEAMVRGERA